MPGPAGARRGGLATDIGVTRAPESAEPGSEALVCWRVEGSGNVPHTAIHYDTESHAGEDASFADYAGGARYPGNQTQQAPDGYDLPGSFCTNVPVGQEDLYFRSHVIDREGAPGKLDAEKVIRVRPAAATVVAVAFEGETPASAAPNSSVPVCWRVEGTGTIPHTAVHSDGESHAAAPATTFTDYDGAAYYPRNQTAQDPASYELPGTFCSNVRVPSTAGQTVYIRAHAIDSGAPGRLSPTERAIQATVY